MQQLTLFNSGIDGDWAEDNWQTPDYVAQLMGGLVLPTDIKVGEPGAGMGQISRYLPQGTICIEKNPSRFVVGRDRAPHCCWLVGDYFEEDLPKFDLIIGNVPFSNCLQFIERSLNLLNRANSEARILFLMPIDFNCGLAKGDFWKRLGCRIHHEYRLQGRVHYLGENGVPQKKRQVYDAVFDIRPVGNSAVSFLE